MFTRRARLVWLVFGFSDLVMLAISCEIAYLIRSHLPDMLLFYLSPAVAVGLLAIAGVLWASTDMVIGGYRRLESLGLDNNIFLRIVPRVLSGRGAS